MDEDDPPRRGPKRTQTLDAIVRAAIRIADVEGLSAISMQRVAREVGFTAMALYRYVPGKTDLVVEMVDTAFGECPPLHGPEWRTRLDHWAHLLWEGFHHHPWVLGATGSLREMGPNELTWLESALAALVDTGLRGDEARSSVLVILAYVRTMAQFSIPPADAPSPPSRAGWTEAVVPLVERSPDRYPALRAAIAAGAFDRFEEDPLASGLARIFDGIAVLVAQRADR